MKGGVGKTTLAVNVGYTLSKLFNKNVLLIDIDPQMNATQYVFNDDQVKDIMNDDRKSIYGILKEKPNLPTVTASSQEDDAVSTIFQIREKFDIIPSHLNVMTVNLNDNPFELLRYIEKNKLKEKYDLIIIDSPPTISPYTKISLLASDAYIVPMKTDSLSLFGLPLLESYISRIKEQFDKELEFVGIVLTMVVPEHLVYKSIKPKIKAHWENKLFEQELNQRIEVVTALATEGTIPYIIELGNDGLKDQMVAITQEIMQRLRI
jgi:chromosome partitioning protein